MTKRVKCTVCNRDTVATKIGGVNYCSVCGHRDASVSRAAAPRRSMDLSPRRQPTPSAQILAKRSAAQVAPARSSQVLEDVTHTTSHAPATAKSAEPKSAAPAVKATHRPATALHSRVKTTAPTGVLDLRTEGPHNAHHLEHMAEEIPDDTIVHTTNHTPAAPPKTAIQERHLAQFTDRFDRAKQIERSQQISKFSGPSLNQLLHPEAVATAAAITPAHHSPAAATFAPVMEMPHAAVTQHQALTNLARHEPAPTPPARTNTPSAGWRPHLSLSPHGSRIMATAAAVAIMSGYIWVQNYPKLALQSAGNKAGLAVTLPSYLPSSYNLAHTTTAPGIVTLSFNSPSATEPLQIVQHSTTWDSNSLLDNFVAKTADDYASIPGQGLTIYLYNNNQATWVNHGVWYSIEGASRLSREQILKIAYSL